MRQGVLALVALLALPAAADWPQWGGPGRDFQVAAKGIAASWPAEGPRVLWRRELGEGYSAITVVAGRLFTMTRRGEDEVVVALDAASGRTLWESADPAPFPPSYDMSHGPGPHAAPLVVDGRVFTAGATGRLRVHDAETGRLLWRRDLISEMGGTPRVNGYAASPVAWRDLVIATVGGPGHAVVAFGQADGDVVWSRHDFANSPSSPLLIEVGGRAQLVAFLYGEVVGLDPASGDLLWSYAHATDFGLNVSTPVFGEDGLLFLSSAYGGGSRGLRLASGPTGTAVSQLWETTRLRLHFGNAVRIGPVIYASSGDFGPAPFVALDVATGRILWRDRRFARASSLALSDGRLLLLDEDGVLALATPGAEGLSVQARVQVLSNPAWTVPTLDGTTLYLRDRKVILAMELGEPQR
ncbi:MAG TPA: PQQ-binding-like beta-propeller repeat protein [Thermoanaerobaculia bacterium]|nr:PQQ-binding-like beta-propeller repeat protein [Thermoanaerobaculia bacterium]